MYTRIEIRRLKRKVRKNREQTIGAMVALGVILGLAALAEGVEKVHVRITKETVQEGGA